MTSIMDNKGCYLLPKISPCYDCTLISKCKIWQDVEKVAAKQQVGVTIICCKHHGILLDDRYKELKKEISDIKAHHNVAQAQIEDLKRQIALLKGETIE